MGNGKDFLYHKVPCGKCLNCLKKRAQDWAFRLEQEEKQHSSCLFVTLTYDDEHLPITDTFYPTLVKSDLQNFMKRLRKLHIHKLKYYAVGEYGTKFSRPHYHIILFGSNFEAIQSAWTLRNEPLGNVYIGDVTPASIRYVTNYIITYSIPNHELNGRIQQFSLMSKGLGKSYITPQIVRYSHNNNITHITKQGGHKIGIPRYYRNHLLTFDAVQQIPQQAQQQHETYLINNDMTQQIFELHQLSVEEKHNRIISNFKSNRNL